MLSVSLFEEQLLRPARAGFPPPEPGGRLLISNLQCSMTPAEAAAAVVMLPATGHSFSIDLRWATAGGDVALRLERLFITAN
jgi:hypothetical protein